MPLIACTVTVIDYYLCQGMQSTLNLFCTSHSVFGCGDPGTPTNGQRTVSGSSATNYIVTYTCDVGYTLQGTHIRRCLSNGQWTGSRPQCIGMSVKYVVVDDDYDDDDDEVQLIGSQEYATYGH